MIAETYDSIGNQVVRNFRHYIDHEKHYWLKSNEKFLPPSVFEGSQLPGEKTSADSTPLGHAKN